MPVDHRRINGPEESVPYELFTRLTRPKANENIPNEKSVHQTKRELDFKINGKHPKIYLQTGIVSQAKGSAYVEIGQTKILISVFDPREIPNKLDYGLKGEVSCEFKFAPFSCKKRKLHQQNNEEKQYSHIMKKALESAVCLHEIPNFQVDVHSLVIQDDGSSLSGAIIGAGVALAEAGVPMYDIITSVTLRIINDELVVESPLSDERSRHTQRRDNTEKENHGILIISKLHTHQQICQFYQSGYISSDRIKSGIKVSSKLCDEIVPVVQKCLLKGVISNIKQ